MIGQYLMSSYVRRYNIIVYCSLLSCVGWLLAGGWVSVTFVYCVETAKGMATVAMECE